MSSPPPKRPKRSRWPRLLRLSVVAFLLALVGLVIALLLWLNSDDFQRRAQDLTEQILERETGEEATHAGEQWFGVWSSGVFFPIILAKDLA